MYVACSCLDCEYVACSCLEHGYDACSCLDCACQCLATKQTPGKNPSSSWSYQCNPLEAFPILSLSVWLGRILYYSTLELNGELWFRYRDNTVDWICYVNLQPAVLQRKLQHSMKTECSCRWSQALHSEQLGGLWHHHHCHQSNSLRTATNVPSARSKEMTSGTSDLFPSTKTHLFYFIFTLFYFPFVFARKTWYWDVSVWASNKFLLAHPKQI